MSLLCLSGHIHLNPGPLIDNCISFWHDNVRGLSSPSKLCSLFGIVNNYNIIALTKKNSMQIRQKSNMLIIYLFFVATDQEDLAGMLQFSSQNLWFQFGNLNLSYPTWRCCGLKLYLELLVGVCYRPPDSGASFWEDIQYSVDMARQAGYSDIIITGDMNSDFNTKDGHNLLNFVNHLSMWAVATMT